MNKLDDWGKGFIEGWLTGGLLVTFIFAVTTFP